MTLPLPFTERQAQEVKDWLTNMRAGEFADGSYRYTLWRIWDPSRARLVIVMLNPSKANAVILDPTVRRCISFAKANGFGGIMVLNLYAWRATDPKELPRTVISIGIDNDEEIRKHVIGRVVLVAWGAPKTKAAERRGVRVAGIIHKRAKRVVCLGTTKAGHPRHPLYVRGSQELIAWPVGQ